MQQKSPKARNPLAPAAWGMRGQRRIPANRQAGYPSFRVVSMPGSLAATRRNIRVGGGKGAMPIYEPIAHRERLAASPLFVLIP